MAPLFRPNNRDGFEIAIVCALRKERDAVEALLDEEYETDGFSYGKAAQDPNAYTTGRLGNQHVVLAYMPNMGKVNAAAVASNIPHSFQKIKIGLVVGICGGVPTTPEGTEILLGDVIISTSVIQIDFGRQYPNGFVRKKELEDTLGRANPEIRAFTERASGYLVHARLKEKTNIFSTQICMRNRYHKSAYPGPENDKLYPPSYRHKHQKPDFCTTCGCCRDHADEVCEAALKSDCEDLDCDDSLLVSRERVQKAKGLGPGGSPILSEAETREAQKALIHFGRIACSDSVMKSGQFRDKIAADEKVIGFEMESAGTWDYIPTVVIKGVSDYSDSHKSKGWQEHAAATAAACAKAFLEEWRTADRSESGKCLFLSFPGSSSQFGDFSADHDIILVPFNAANCPSQTNSSVRYGRRHCSVPFVKRRITCRGIGFDLRQK
jgi:nucleoside phosphorylase